MNPERDYRIAEMYPADFFPRLVNFHCPAPAADEVCLAGDFNHWQPTPMERHESGWWFLQISLPPGRHQYHFVVDGEPMLDIHASGMAWNERNQPVSLITVG